MHLTHLLPTTLSLLALTTTAAPITPRTSMLNLNWTKSAALKTINDLMSQLPVNAELWALDQEAGMLGVNVDLDMGELAKVGLVQVSSNRNARVSVNVTVSGLD